MSPERLRELIARFQDKPEMVAALQRQLDEALRVQYPTNAPLDSEAERDRANQGLYDAPKQERKVVPEAAQQINQTPVAQEPVISEQVAPVFDVATHGDGTEYEYYPEPIEEQSTGGLFIPKSEAANVQSYVPQQQNWRDAKISDWFNSVPSVQQQLEVERARRNAYKPKQYVPFDWNSAMNKRIF